MKRLIIFLFLNIYYLLLSTNYLCAQDVRLPQVDVTDIRTGENPDNIPARINIISKQQIENYPGLSADEYLNLISGINEYRYYGIFNKTGDVNIRGLNRNVHSLLLLDGMPFSLINGGAANWNHIDPAIVDRIIVIKGPNSYLYGNNAMGGVINIITKRPDKFLDVNANVFYGTYNTKGASLNLMGRADNIVKGLYWRLTGYYRNSDGYIMTPEDTRTVYDVKTYLDEYNGSAILGYQLNSKNIIEVEYNYAFDKRGNGARVFEKDGSYNSFNTGFFRGRYSGLIAGTRIEVNTYLKNENNLSQSEGVKKKTGLYTFYNSENMNTDKGLLMNLSRSIFKNNIIIAGADFKHGETDASNIYRTSTDTISYAGKMDFYGVFLQDEHSLFDNKLKITLAARLDKVFFYNGNFDVKAPSAVSEFMIPYIADYNRRIWNAFSPKAGLKYFFNKNINFYISYSQGFRPATLNDLCQSGDVNKGFKLPNPDLKPEKTVNYEAGVTKSNEQRTLNSCLSVYYMLGKDFQYFVSTGKLVATTGDNLNPEIKRENIKRADIYGIELDITYKFSPTFSFISNYTYNISKITSFQLSASSLLSNDLTGKDLINVPEHLAFAALLWDNRFVNTTLTCKYKGSQWADDNNTILLGDQVNFDMKLLKKINKHYTASVTIQNILDRRYPDSKGLLNPGRFIIAQLNFNLR